MWQEVQHEECNWQTLVWQQDGHEGQVHEVQEVKKAEGPSVDLISWDKFCRI